MSVCITCILFIFITYIWMKFVFFHCYQDQLNLENFQQQYFSLIIVYFHPNIVSVFLYRLITWIFLHNLSLTLYCYLMHYHRKSFLVFPHSIEPRILTWAIWNNSFYIVGMYFFSWKTSITPSCRTKQIFAIIIPLLYLSSMLSHISHLLLYLNAFNPCIKIWICFEIYII